MPQSNTTFLESTLGLVAPRRSECGPGSPQLLATATRSDRDRIEEIAVICHELRNSLGVVSNVARLLRLPANVDAAEAGALIERHAGHMRRHIEELLEPLSRGARNQGLQFSRIDLRVIARHAADAIAPEMANRGHRLVVKLPGDAVWAHADGASLERAFMNLLINAAKYTPDGGDIALTMMWEKEHVSVRVRDSGIGIDPAMLSRVFGMFVRIERHLPSNEGGRGIGLAVVRNLVELHGGSVSAASAGLGSGSEFTIVLPTL